MLPDPSREWRSFELQDVCHRSTRWSRAHRLTACWLRFTNADINYTERQLSGAFQGIFLAKHFIIFGQKVLQASNIFVMITVTAKIAQLQVSASPYTRWLLHLHLFLLAFVFKSVQVHDTWSTLKITPISSLEKIIFTKPPHILAQPKKYLCEASISVHIVRCRKQRKPGKAG